MKGIVWGSTISDAIKRLERIEEEYERYRIPLVFKRKNDKTYELEYSNGDHWYATEEKISIRGVRCNISYVDKKISKDFFDKVIKNCTIAGPYRAFNFY